MLTPAEPGRRNRRTLDALLATSGALVLGLFAVIAYSAPLKDEILGSRIALLVGWAPGLWRLLLLAALVLATTVVVDTLTHRRWALMRDIVAALLLACVLGSLLGRIVESDWTTATGGLFSRWGFPDLRFATATSVIIVAFPELVRPVRRFATWIVLLGALGTIGLRAASPASAMAGLALGLGAAALVRLGFGSPAGVPPTGRVRRALDALGVDVAELTIARRQRVGAADYVARDEQGCPLRIRVLGRDAQETQKLARRWRLLAYREPVRGAPIGRLEQVEHEALVTLLAAQAGVHVPQVVAVGLGPDGDAILATRQPDATRIESLDGKLVSDELLRNIWRQVYRLHAAGIAHGRLNLSNVIIDDDGRPMLVNLDAATTSASRAALDIDIAELLVACAVVVGAERTLTQAVSAGWGPAVARTLPYLQRAALTPHMRDLAREHDLDVAELRTTAAVVAGTDEPEVVSLRRAGWREVLTMAVVAVAAYLLITQLADIGVGTILRQLHDADPAWLVCALIVAQLTYVPQGISLRGTVATPLPLQPCIVLQSAIKFINLTVPSSAGRIAFNIRFLQRLGAPSGEAVAASAVDGVSETIVEIALISVLLVFVDVQIDSSQLHFAAPSAGSLFGIGVAVIASAACIFGMPRLRAKILPQLRIAVTSLSAVIRDRKKRLELFGGTILTEVVFALALGAVCNAFGVELALSQLLLVNMGASVLAGLLPVPGGIGAAEAAITAGLVAVGVDEGQAFAIAFTHRLCTYYLPPVLGYISLRWLQRRAYL